MPFPSRIKRIHLDFYRNHTRVVFDVVDHFEEILDAFRSDEEDPHPAKWKHAGELTIEPKDPANLDENPMV
jgi:hypothetical protein